MEKSTPEQIPHLTEDVHDKINRISTYDDQFIRSSQAEDSHCSQHNFSHPLKLTEHSLSQENDCCRICLEGNEEGKLLLSPCRCSSMIHDSCLLQWIGHREGQSDDEAVMKCQVCKENYDVDIIGEYGFTCQLIKQENNMLRRSFLGYLLIWLLLTALFASIIGFAIEIGISSEFSQVAQTFLHLPRNSIFVILGLFGMTIGVFWIGLFFRILTTHCFGYNYTLQPKTRHHS